MDADPQIPPDIQKRNVIESVLGICNVYSKSSTIDMFTGAHHAQLVADHQSTNPSSSLTTKDTLLAMKNKLVEWGVDLQWVILFPHINDLNGHGDPRHNWLGVVSCTVNDYHHLVGKTKYVTKRREIMTFCQCKVHEDMQIRETCVKKIHNVIYGWTSGLPREQMDANVLAASIHSAQTDALIYQATHQNKCMY
jgi:hypothetical protein